MGSRRSASPRAVIGNADEAQMRKVKRFKELLAEGNRSRVSAIKGDALLDLARSQQAA